MYPLREFDTFLVLRTANQRTIILGIKTVIIDGHMALKGLKAQFSSCEYGVKLDSVAEYYPEAAAVKTGWQEENSCRGNTTSYLEHTPSGFLPADRRLEDNTNCLSPVSSCWKP